MTTSLPARCPAPIAPLPSRGSNFARQPGRVLLLDGNDTLRASESLQTLTPPRETQQSAVALVKQHERMAQWRVWYYTCAGNREKANWRDQFRWRHREPAATSVGEWADHRRGDCGIRHTSPGSARMCAEKHGLRPVAVEGRWVDDGKGGGRSREYRRRPMTTEEWTAAREDGPRGRGISKTITFRVE